MRERYWRQLQGLVAAFEETDMTGGRLEDFPLMPPAEKPPKPPELIWRDYAIMLLHIASAIEHALMVQYLFAAHSLGGEQVPREYRTKVENWRYSILAVAKEEMGHLLTVQNVLALLGGPVSLDREDHPWDHPFYPAPFTLAPLSLGTLAIYVFAEQPDDWDDDEAREIRDRALKQAKKFQGAQGQAESGSPPPHRVGIIYQTLIRILSDHNCIPDDAFHADSVPQQANWDEWGRGYHGGPRDANVLVDVVATRDQAVEALRKISSQGESPNAARRAVKESVGNERPAAIIRLEQRVESEKKKAAAAAGGDAPSQDRSHFERFRAIYREFVSTAGADGWKPARDVAVNPMVLANSTDETPPGCTAITDERSKLWASLFNLRYRMLLAYLTHALLLARQEEDGEAPSIRGAVMHRVFGEMYNLRTIAGILVRRPAGADGPRAGPPFQMPYTLALPATLRNRWLMYKDLILEARDLRQQLASAPSQDEAGYLAAAADIDRQTGVWLDQLLAGAAPRRRAMA
jgi:hypothetical protein